MMEFLNNIWAAICTPNELCVKIFSIPMAFIESALIFYFISNLFKLDVTAKRKFTYILGTAAVSIISLFFLDRPFNILFNYITLFVITYFVLKINFLKSVIATVFPTIFFVIMQSLLFNPYITLLHITSEQLLTIALYKVPLSLFTYTVVFILIFTFKHRNWYINLLDELDKKTKSLIILNLLFALAYIMIEVVITMQYLDVFPLSYTFANFIMLSLYFFVSIYSISKVVKLKSTAQALESAEEYNKTLRILHDNVRGFKHDFDNIVTTIGGYVNTDDIEGLKSYYVQLQQDCAKVNNLYVLNPSSINNPGIYNLLTSKYHEATEKGIDVNIYYLLDLNELHMKIYEFGRILGILLDNAIEAAEMSKEKVINISFRKDSKNSRNIILIENSYSNKLVNTDSIFEKGMTEKENHTGLGLWEVRKIISQNNNVNLYTSKTELLFKQQLEIYFT